MSDAEMFRKPAAAYDRFIGRYAAALGEELVAFARVERGMRALDVGCGPGGLTAVLAARLGAEHVAAAEPSEPFAAACRERVPGVEVVAAGAEALPFPDGAFDAALAQLVVNFMADAPAGVREMARVTRAGGVVGACVWDYAGEMTFLRAFWDAAREVEPERASAADEGPRMRYCDPASLEALWREAGLDDVRSAALVVSAGYSGFDDLWAPLLAGIGPAGAFTAAASEDARAALRTALRDRLGAGDEPFSLSARAFAVVGAPPETSE